jgi:hypothetical protein
MVAEIRGVDLGESDITDVIGSMRSLPAHAEVSAAVAKLPSSWFHSILTRYCIADPSRCSAQQGDPDLVKTHAPTFFMVSLDVETNL